MKLRLWHHRDGARVAYREAGIGPVLILVHSATLSHREFVPVVEHLTHRFASSRPTSPARRLRTGRAIRTPEWMAEVIGAFCRVGGRAGGGRPRPGAELLSATATGDLRPGRLADAQRAAPPARARDPPGAVVTTARAAAVPGLDRALSHGARLVFRPSRGLQLSARGNPAAADLYRHAFADVGGNANLARSWARHAKAWPSGARRDLLDVYPRITAPTLLLWADQDPLHPLQGAREALDLLPNGQLRVLEDTGYLLAYDDPVGTARELLAFCR